MRVPVVSHPFAKPRLSSAKAELALVRMQCSKASQVRFRPKADMGLAPAQQGAPVQFGPHVTERAAQAHQLHMPFVASNVHDVSRSCGNPPSAGSRNAQGHVAKRTAGAFTATGPQCTFLTVFPLTPADDSDSFASDHLASGCSGPGQLLNHHKRGQANRGSRRTTSL
jgi:hypothetical protein